MKLTLIILATLFAVTFASPIKPASIIDSLSHLLYIHLNPIFQNTLQQLTQLVYELGEKLSQTIEYQSIPSNRINPAPWFSEMFGEMNSIATQWNNQVSQFFTNIPTIFENHGRSLFNFSIIKQKLHETVANLLEELRKLFINNINKLNLMETIGRKRGEFHIDALFNAFQQQVSGVFEKTKEQLNDSVDHAIDVILIYWNDLKDRVVG